MAALRRHMWGPARLSRNARLFLTMTAVSGLGTGIFHPDRDAATVERAFL